MPLRQLMIVFGLAIMATLSPFQANADERDRAWQIYRRRQAAADTVRITWTTQLGLSKGNLPSSGTTPTAEADVLTPEFPNTLILCGNRARYETSLVSFRNGQHGDLVSSLETFDGTERRTLTNNEYGVIEQLPAFDPWVNISLAGPRFSLRPLRPEAFGPTPGGWTIDDRPAMVDGVHCIVLARSAITTSGRRRVVRLYLDPEREYVPLRYETENNGRLSTRADMRYERLEEPRWVPSSWTSAFYVRGTPSERTESRLEEVAFDVEVSDDMFTIAYSPQTEVVVKDEGNISAGKGLPREARYVVTENGDFAAPRRATAEHTQVADDGIARWPLIPAAIGAAALGVALLLWRRYARAT